ncbi:hypothetical protein ILYODFUR_014638, partial [Ilyodon furcidens]
PGGIEHQYTVTTRWKHGCGKTAPKSEVLTHRQRRLKQRIHTRKKADRPAESNRSQSRPPDPQPHSVVLTVYSGKLNFSKVKSASREAVEG